MICKNCGGSCSPSDTKCPYCGSINEIAVEKQNSPKSPESLTLHKGLIKGIYTTLTLTMIVTALLAYYYNNFDQLKRSNQVKGINRIKNLELIHTYLDNKQYLRALSVGYNTDPSYSNFESYPEVQEELLMIYAYSSFLYDIQSYITTTSNLDYIDCSKYQFQYAKDFYNTFPTTERSINIKEELGMSLDLYLEYYYQLTDEEILDLKEALTIDDFQIEGTSYFEGILKERIIAYEKTH